MDTKNWRKLLNESSVIVEAVDFLNKESDPHNENKVQLILERKISGITAWYRLETDGWWRRVSNPGKGYGILMTKFKISGQPKNISAGGGRFGTIRFIEYPVLISYIPIEYSTEVDWNNPKNEEKAKGTLMINTHETDAVGKDIENFVNQQIKKGTYQP